MAVKRKATPAQLRALAKGRRALALKRKNGGAKRGPAKTTVRKPTARKSTARKTTARKTTYARARKVLRNPARAKSLNARLTHGTEHVITVNGRYFEGAGFTSSVQRAARYHSLDQARIIAQKVADVTKKTVAIKKVKG